MIKDHSGSKRENPLPLHGLLILISSKGSFTHTIPQTGHHILWPLQYQLWSTGWNVAQKVHYRKEFVLFNHSTHFVYGLYGIRHTVKDHSDNERGNPLLPQSYISLLVHYRGSTQTTHCSLYKQYPKKIYNETFLMIS